METCEGARLDSVEETVLRESDERREDWAVDATEGFRAMVSVLTDFAVTWIEREVSEPDEDRFKSGSGSGFRYVSLGILGEGLATSFAETAMTAGRWISNLEVTIGRRRCRLKLGRAM